MASLTNPIDFVASGYFSNNTDLLFRCWRLQTCDTCLSTTPCVWCPISSTCVPSHSTFPLLAPIGDENICPLGWRERLELRTRPFGCRCSTFTLIAVLTSVVCTLGAVLLLWSLTVLVRWTLNRWRARSNDWWRVWCWQWKGRRRWPTWLLWQKGRQNDGATAVEGEEQETQPLLG